MNPLDTLIGQKLHTAIEVNGILIPANSIAAAIVSFVDPALFHTNEMEPFNYFISGSTFRIKYRNRYFVVCTEHQLRNVTANVDQLVVMGRCNPQTLISSHRAVWDKTNSLDLNLFEFTESVEEGALSRNIWYHAKKAELFETVPAPNKCYCVGYPGETNQLDFDGLEFDCKPYSVYGDMSPPAMRNRLSFAPETATGLSPSGMSGSPVFGITLDDLTPATYWAGILSNASNHIFNFIPANKVGQMLSAIGAD